MYTYSHINTVQKLYLHLDISIWKQCCSTSHINTVQKLSVQKLYLHLDISIWKQCCSTFESSCSMYKKFFMKPNNVANLGKYKTCFPFFLISLVFLSAWQFSFKTGTSNFCFNTAVLMVWMREVLFLIIRLGIPVFGFPSWSFSIHKTCFK